MFREKKGGRGADQNAKEETLHWLTVYSEKNKYSKVAELVFIGAAQSFYFGVFPLFIPVVMGWEGIIFSAYGIEAY